VHARLNFFQNQHVVRPKKIQGIMVRVALHQMAAARQGVRPLSVFSQATGTGDLLIRPVFRSGIAIFKNKLIRRLIDMAQSDTAAMVKNAVGVAGGAALIAPVAPPLLHGLAGIAVVGLGIFAAGSLVFKAAEAFKGMDNPLKPKEEPKKSM